MHLFNIKYSRCVQLAPYRVFTKSCELDETEIGNINSLDDALLFVTHGASPVYWAVVMDNAHRNQAASTLYHDMYRFVKMLFGLQNERIRFQGAMDGMITPVKWQSAFLYPDESFTLSRNADEHILYVCAVMSHLHKTSVTLDRVAQSLNLKLKRVDQGRLSRSRGRSTTR